PVTLAHGWQRGATGMSWSPDGNTIWISGTSTSAPPALYEVNADGTTQLVSRLPGSLRIFDVSKRGDALMASGTWRAALMWKPPNTAPAAPPVAVTATTTAPLTPADEPERDASWLDWSILADLSPDGKTVLFSETREGGGSNAAVYVRQLGAPAPL